MTQYVIFDLDDTLLDFSKAEHTSLVTILNRYHVPDLATALHVYQAHNQEVWYRIEQGADREPLLNNRFKIVMDQLGIHVDGAAVQREYDDLLAHGYQILPGARQLLQTLQAAGKTLLIATNGVLTTQLSRIRGAQLNAYFQHVYISEALGHAKPDVRFFEAVYRDNPAMTPANTVMVGDSLRSDILGGQRAHLQTVWFNPHAADNDTTLVPTLTATNFNQIQQFILH